ncbi:hypothetical protein [Geodermatophilus marinus]|uniref:hypothetical protein n=1 Tax=Geodermatophilus sp. LHW52908 TaxID=2303986 RepID=UPI000E3C73B1|nr:hypothetical protein [Geodermatophilus sp. LHW52908]RFU19961.1 hypothetical protein D0Z06_18575 [Geodermatophilus sp. LHW52908]
MKRTVGFGALWTASAAVAVGLGLLAVDLVDTGASADTVPVAATDTPSPSRAPGPSAGTSTSTPPPAPAPVPSSSGEQVTVAGTVFASCDAAGVLSLASAPAPGWWLDDSQDPGEVEFENGTQDLEVKVSCVAGAPRFLVEGPRADSSGRGRGGDDTAVGSTVAPAPSSGTPSAGTPSVVDDSDGRVGGGHGSDDPPGDDSAGRVDDSGDDDGDDDRGRGRGRGSDD